MQLTTTTTNHIDILTNSFEKFVRTRVSNGNPSQSTVRTYIAKIRYFIQWCLDNNINPGTCTEEDIVSYRSHLINKSYKPNTIKLYLRIVNRFYTALVLNTFYPLTPLKT
ncbi:phage integrase N-terminal SAM-like domain-containing protein [Myxosarcina sp. GI1(2024)]